MEKEIIKAVMTILREMKGEELVQLCKVVNAEMERRKELPNGFGE